MKNTHLKILTFSFLFAFKAQAQSPGDIIITEFMADPAKVSDASGEWLEIYNASSKAIEMNRWHISDGKTKTHTINSINSLTIQPNGFLLFAIKSDSTLNGGLVPDYAYSNFTFANASGKIVITDVDGVVIDSLVYSNSSAGKSWSLDPQHFNSSENDNFANWCAGSTAYGAGDLGTPKKMNAACNTTGIIPISTKNNVSIYVKNGELAVLFSDVLEKQKWEIVDITGRIVQAGAIHEATNSFNVALNKNNRGMYFFRLYKSGNTLKFIIE